jgi:hypothetical protein
MLADIICLQIWGAMNLDDFAWKDLFGTFGALIGMISALITALGTMAAYKLKKAEKTAAPGTPVRILSLKEQRSLNWTVLIIKIAGYGTIILFPIWIISLIWRFGLEVKMIAILIITYLAIAALYLFILSRVRGDLSQRRSRTKSETTVTVQAPYDVAFAKCNDAILRLKCRMITLDFENGIIDSERISIWYAPFILNVKISRIDPDRCSIYVETDSAIPTTLFDFGMNSRRLTRFVREMIQ